MPGTGVARRAVTESALALWESKQVQLIKHTIMPDGSNDGELALFLEVCARYELDPFTQQIWPVKFKGKVRNVVGRDGWTALANRHDDFRGVQAFEIREHDLFEYDIVGGHVEVKHKYRDAEGKPTHGGRDGSLRGSIIGGFAYARREGHIDTLFMAYSDQYDKQENAWKTHPTAMVMKVAHAMCLRQMYPISGLYAEGELEPDRVPTNLSAPTSPAPIDFGPDEELAHQLEDAFRHLGYTRAKVRTIMRGCGSREDREAVLRGLQAEADGDAVVVEPTAA